MKIHNTTSGTISISDLPGPQGLGLTLGPLADKVIYDEDAEKSAQLLSLMTSGLVTKLSDEEPADGGATADTDVAAAAGLAAAALPKAGGTMTGAIAMGGFKVTGLGAPTGAADAARKTESDAALSAGAAAQATADAALPKTGGTMSGTIAMGGLQILQVGAPLFADSAARKTDSDAALTAANDAQADATQALADAAAAAATANAAQVAANLLFIDSAPGAGGGATEALTVTGLLATDTILGVSQSVPGANSLPLLGFNTQALGLLTGVWSADPGAGAVIRVAIKR